jgi:DNA-binding transcriptional MerR regulator
MLSTRGDGLLTAEQAGRKVGVAAATIRTWVHRGVLKPAGLSERGHPLYTPQAVTDAEEAVRQRSLRTSGIDPRRLRRQRPTAA